MKLLFVSLSLILTLNSIAQADTSTPLSVQQTDTITIKMTPAISKRVVLYSAVGAQQKYVCYADSENGEFKLAVPANQIKGMYRLVFDQKTMNYIDFLYLNRSFELQFDPTRPDDSIVFVDSDENKRYYTNLNEIGLKQQKVDSLQVLYFQTQDSLVLKDIETKYATHHNLLNSYLENFNENENDLLLKDLINANTRAQPLKPIKDPQEYLPYVKEHYFDAVDFSNKNLIHSSILIDKVMDYVFYLTISRDTETQNNLYKSAVTDVLGRIDYQILKANFIQALIQAFTKDENTELVDYLFLNYYDKLEQPFQNSEFKKSIQDELKTAVGRKAAEIEWKENEEQIKLTQLEDYDYYIIAFWSTTCPHCMKEIPKLHEYTKEKKNIKVIAIGMETEESKGAWKSETYYHPTFSHVLGLGKWENPIARAYNVHSSPNYFVLDSDKKIIAKPYEFVDVEAFFEEVSSP